jgi:RNA polymerase sigma-70 factor (ECF subfamily)
MNSHEWGGENAVWSSPDTVSGNDDGFDRAALRRQDAVEFARLYEAFAPRLWAYLVRLCGDAEMAQDLVQETFVKAYHALPRAGPQVPLRPWLFKIATNTARSALRLAQWRRTLPLSSRAAEPYVLGDDSFESRYAEAELVERTLYAIRPDYAAALLLHWREGFSIDELCDILGLSRENLKKRLYRAKRAFMTTYGKECAMSEAEEARR